MKRFLLSNLIIVLFALSASSQVFTNRQVAPKKLDGLDSLNSLKYPYVLPILGQKATNAGFDLPYSAGISINYFVQTSDIILENLEVGFNGGEKFDLSSLVQFDVAKARASALTFRPDVWLLPFLNVYGILGRAQASTEVKYRVNVPDSINTFLPILSGSSFVEFQTTTFGFGLTPTIGIKGGFLALDMNIAWTDVPQLQRPTRTFVFGPRIGKNFRLKKPERSIAVWVGGFRVNLMADTDGSLPLSEAIDVDDFGGRIQVGFEKVDMGQQKVDAWWESLSPIEQRNPLNIARRNAANRALELAGEVLVAADNALSEAESSTVQYSMDRRVADPWNFLTGAQFQVNKHWMIRVEAGYLSSRTQFMGGLQYRFGL
jgi:hypothetical protein